MAALITEAKPRQLQVTRIRQEEEDSWISSEELHTDGSSDDDGGRWGGKHLQHHQILHHIPHPLHHRLPTSSPLATSGPLSSPPPPSTASEPASQDSPHLTETTRRLSELGVEGAALVQGAPPDSPSTQEDCVEEQEDIMLWRPKRGSLKLTELATGAITLSSTAGKLLQNIVSPTDIAEEKVSSAASAAPDSSSGVISKCSSITGATTKSPAPLPSAGSVEAKGSSSAAGQTAASSSAAAKVANERSDPGVASASCVKSCSATTRDSATPAVAEITQNATVNFKNKDIAVQSVGVDAKAHKSGT